MKFSSRVVSILSLLSSKVVGTTGRLSSSSLKRRDELVGNDIPKPLKFQPFLPSNDEGEMSITLSDQENRRNSETEEDSSSEDISWIPFANMGLFASENDITDMTDFLNLWSNSPNQIIWRRCDDCTSTEHKNIYYRRWDTEGLPDGLDLIDLLKNNWFSSPLIEGNDFNVNFSLYSTYADAVNDQNRWSYCNFNDPTVGFPRDCSPTSHTPFQWNSFVRTDGLEKKDVAFYMENSGSGCASSQMKVDVSVTTDQYPEDTHWVVEISNGESISVSSPDPLKTVDTTMCLEASACHFFYIFDAWGDGLREGNFTVAVDDQIVLSNPESPFTSMDVELCKSTRVPTTSPTVDFTSTACTADQTLVEISVTTDSYPEETSWTIASSVDGQIIHESDPYTQSYTTNVTQVCLGSSQCYAFTFFDSWGDGLLQGGQFTVKVDGDQVLSNPADGSVFSSLEVNIGDCTPTNTNLSLTVQSSGSNIQDAQSGKIAILAINEIYNIFEDNHSRVEDGSDIFDEVHIKGNQGFVVRAKNHRSGKEGGLMIWSNSTDAFGTWNPREFAQENDFIEGDSIELLLDFEGLYDKTFAENVTSTLLTGTGWNLPAEAMRFGQCGLVGDWWNELELEYEFETDEAVWGVCTDSVTLAYEIKYEDSQGIWNNYIDANADNRFTGTTLFSAPVVARKWRLYWNTTDLFQTSGLSTYRGGGGLHAELLL